MCELLVAGGIKAEWQLRHASGDVLKQVCVNEGSDRLDVAAFTLASEAATAFQKAQPKHNTASNQLERFQTESLKALQAVATRARVGTARARRDQSPSSSEGNDETSKRHIDVCQAMSFMGLETMPLENLPKGSILQPMLRKTLRRVGKNCLPWVGGLLQKSFEPLWRANDKTLREPPQGEPFASFAHFSSCWWSRALAQCAAQAESGSESVSFERLLRRFLDLCRLAQEENCFAAYEYDKHKLDIIQTRVECNDKRVDPNQLFQRVDADTEKDVKDKIGRARAAQKPDKGAGKQQQPAQHLAQGTNASDGRVRLPPPPPPLGNGGGKGYGKQGKRR